MQNEIENSALKQTKESKIHLEVLSQKDSLKKLTGASKVHLHGVTMSSGRFHGRISTGTSGNARVPGELEVLASFVEKEFRDRDKVIGKKWIYLERNALPRERTAHLRRQEALLFLSEAFHSVKEEV